MKFKTKWKCIVLKKQQTHVIKYAGFENKATTRGQLRGSWESAAAHTLFIFLAIAWLSSHTTSVLQTTIKGWWWLSKRTTTLWDYSGQRNRFLRITYICPDEQKVSTIEAEGTWPIPFVWNCHNNKHLAFEGQINKVNKTCAIQNIIKGLCWRSALWGRSSWINNIRKNILRW